MDLWRIDLSLDASGRHSHSELENGHNGPVEIVNFPIEAGDFL